MKQGENLYFYYYKRSESQVKFQENFREISQIPKIREKFPRKSPENSRKTPSVFSCKCNVTAVKSLFLLLDACCKSRKISEKISGKSPKFQKFTEEISPENFPEIPGVFFGETQ